MMLRAVRRTAVLVLLAALGTGYALWETPAGPTTRAPLAAGLTGAFVALSSPDFIAFGVMTLWLTYALVDVRGTRRLPRLIRLGTVTALLRNTAGACSRFIVAGGLMVGFASAIAVVVGSAHLRDGPPAVGQLPAGAPLVVAILAQGGLLTAFLTATRLIIELLAMTFSFGVAVGTSAAMWAWGALSVNGALPIGPGGRIEAYSSVRMLAQTPGLLLPVCLTYALVISAIAASAIALDRAARQRPAEIPEWLPPCVGAFVLVLLATFALGTASGSAFTHALVVFAGSSGSLLQTLIELVLVVGYAFLALFRLERDLGGRAAVTLIRYGSRRRQIVGIARRETGLATIFAVAVLVSTALAYLIAGGRDFTPPPMETGILLLLVLTVLQILQIVFYVGCIAAVRRIVDSSLAGLVTVGVIVALAALPIPTWLPIPIQRSATGSVVPGGWPEILRAALVLVIAAFVVFAIASAPRQIRLKAPAHPRGKEEHPHE
jgi:hypothetical protein